MKKLVLFFLGAISFDSSNHGLMSAVSCIDEIVEFDYVPNLSRYSLIAPRPILNTLPPNLFRNAHPREAIGEDAVNIYGTTDKPKNNLFLGKILIDMNKSESETMIYFKEWLFGYEDPIVTEAEITKTINNTFYKKSHRCTLNGKIYNVYVIEQPVEDEYF